MYWGTCVVLPQPVSPASRMTWWLRTASAIWSLHHHQRNQASRNAACLTEEPLLHAWRVHSLVPAPGVQPGFGVSPHLWTGILVDWVMQTVGL